MKAKTIFFCTECGNEFPKWQGRCPAGAVQTMAAESSVARVCRPEPFGPAMR